jgi:hypothetical protein
LPALTGELIAVRLFAVDVDDGRSPESFMIGTP